VVNNTPISHALELGAERIDVLPTEDPAYRPADYAPRTALDAAIYGLPLLIHSRLESDIARYSPEVELIVLPAPNPGQVQPTSFEHAARLMIDARIAARAVLAGEDAGRHLRLAG
jgi:NTE family protein